MTDLAVVLPVYNEAEALESVLSEWIEELTRQGLQFQLFCFDDGSNDATPILLKDFAQRWPQLRVVSKANSGHGPTVLYGYRHVLEQSAASWVFQIDSDGQCDPKFFEGVWSARNLDRPVYGWRTHRDDGWARLVISRFLTLAVWLATGRYVRDSNVPYRLFHRRQLESSLGRVPEGVHLANVLVAIHDETVSGINWVPINFRSRSGGEPSLRWWGFVKAGWELFWDARRFASLLREDLR